jgi:hypothetical protein
MGADPIATDSDGMTPIELVLYNYEDGQKKFSAEISEANLGIAMRLMEAMVKIDDSKLENLSFYNLLEPLSVIITDGMPRNASLNDLFSYRSIGMKWKKRKSQFLANVMKQIATHNSSSTSTDDCDSKK